MGQQVRTIEHFLSQRLEVEGFSAGVEIDRMSFLILEYLSRPK